MYNFFQQNDDKTTDNHDEDKDDDEIHDNEDSDDDDDDDLHANHFEVRIINSILDNVLVSEYKSISINIVFIFCCYLFYRYMTNL